jgi:hypothetical protein
MEASVNSFSIYGKGSITYQRTINENLSLRNSGSTAKNRDSASAYVAFEFQFSYESLNIPAQKILENIQALIANTPTLFLNGKTEGSIYNDKARELIAKRYEADLPKTDEYTPEKTADKIMKGVGLLFDRFTAQNPKLSQEALVDEFMKLARSGVDKGYSSAFSDLETIGAFEVNGIKDGIERTKMLLEEKLSRFEESKKKPLSENLLKDPASEVVSSQKQEQNRSEFMSIHINA